jgi:AmmeMemoRadiSam system protein A
MPCTEYDSVVRARLLNVARAAVESGVRSPEQALPDRPVDLHSLDSQLVETRATFVTLSKLGDLRGCTGSLEATRPLIDDVAHNAWRTALCDPRFPSVVPDELNDVSIEISVLSALRAMPVRSERELLARLNPTMGLVIECAGHRATFLPKVWRSLPDPQQFLAELKCKAGMPHDYWSDALQVFSYHTESFAESG